MKHIYEDAPVWESRSMRIEIESLGTVRGICVGYPQGAKVVLYGNQISFEETDHICLAMVYDFGPYFRPLLRGHSPGELGMNTDDGPVGYFACHSCPVGSTPPAQSHGSVIFRVSTRQATTEELKRLPRSRREKVRASQDTLRSITRKARATGEWMPTAWPVPGIPETASEALNPIPESEATRVKGVDL